MDETAMRQALDILRAQVGDRLPGDMLKGEVQMRQVLIQQMRVDESTADKLVKQLTQTGWLVFHGSGANEDEGNSLNPPVGMGGRAAGDLDTWTGDEAVGTPDAARIPAAPFIAGAAMTGMQTGSTATAAGAGPAVVGAAAAGLAGRETAGAATTGADNTVTGANVPDANQDAINSYAADANPPDPRGYWAIGTISPAPAGDLTTATLGVTPPPAISAMPATPGDVAPLTTDTMSTGDVAPLTTDTMPPATRA